MLFNSLEFAIFLPIVFIIYWLVLGKRHYLQNIFLLLSSYIFYGLWNWYFLILIIFNSLINFIVGIKLEKIDNPLLRKGLFFLAIIINLTPLILFKYTNFLIESFSDLLSLVGFNVHITTLYILLPLGISFYTFKTLSYIIDVYTQKIKASTNILSFFVYVSFFPQLIAGPIERASSLLTQINKERKFNYNLTVDGMRQILWGLFQKIVIADTLAKTANIVFTNHTNMIGSDHIIGILYFTFQIYCDFAGYSNISIGVSKLLGFPSIQNFNYPYFSKNIAEFWNKWHISLSHWFRDYIFIPLGGNRCKNLKYIRNIIVTFALSGLWHGSGYTYLVWGILNGIYYIPLIFHKIIKKENNITNNSTIISIKKFLQIISTFVMISFAWIFFRAESITDALLYIQGFWTTSIFEKPTVSTIGIIFIIVFIM